MRIILWSCLIVVGLSCARATKAPSSAIAVASESNSWKSCSVARALARQFVRGLSLLAEVDSYLAEDGIAFRVCDHDNLSCNGPSQPFPGDCKDRSFSRRLSKSVETSWSSAARPRERSTSYAVVFIEDRANEVVAKLALGCRFTGNPDGNPAGPNVSAGVTETSADAPTIRVVIPKDGATTTSESAILLGEREIEP